MFTKEMWRSEELETMVRTLQPHIIINNRASLPGDFDTPEGYTGFFQNTRMWETCMTLGKHWSYSQSEIKSKRKLLSEILNCVGGDGNYLLSIGCKPDGSIAENEANRMIEIGDWFKQYGETVFDTRGGIWKPTKKYAACYKNNFVYLHCLGKFPTTLLKLPIVKNQIVSAECLTGEKINVTVSDGNLKIKISGKKIDTIDTIIKITLAKTPVMEY